MPQPNRRNGTNLRVARNIALAAAIGLTALSLSQCRMVDDNVTGLTLQAGRLSGRSACTKQCNETFEAAVRAEQQRHVGAERECGSDANCHAAEGRTHVANVAQIEEGRKVCKKGCYNEGSGASK